MNRTGLISLLLIAAWSSPLWGQQGQVQSRALEVWKQTEPTLENDAIANAPTLGARSDKVNLEAGRYFAARRAFLNAVAAQFEKDANTLSGGSSPIAPDPDFRSRVAAQTNAVNTSLAAVVVNPSLDELKRALEAERGALAALGEAIRQTQDAQDGVVATQRKLETARVNLAAHMQDLAGLLKQTADETQNIAGNWSAYYRSLGDAVRRNPPTVLQINNAAAANRAAVPAAAPAVASRTPVDIVVVGPQPRGLVDRTPEATAAAGDRALAADTPTRNAQVTVTPAAAPIAASVRVPAPSEAFPALSRYTGSWVYPKSGEHYHGAHPSQVELTVLDTSGIVRGNFSARFLNDQGSKMDPSLEFSFQGRYQGGRSQKLDLVTNSGVTGTLELIPALDPNMLEIRFNTGENPGKVRAGNFFVVRK